MLYKRAVLLLPTMVFLALAGVLSAQSSQRKWWVEFTDKAGTPFCTCRPSEFLSARALERRARANIPVTETDLPVNPAYLRALTDRGARLHNRSRWLNAATIIADSTTALHLRSLPFVRKVVYLGPDITIKNPPDRPAKTRKPLKQIPEIPGVDNLYGYAALQNSQLGLPALHAAGHRGKGIWIAVMDGGFANVDTMPFFDSLALQGRLFPGWDFVERDGAVYESAQHGTSVLSVMGADLPGFFVGTAPDATYFLLKTEDTGGEYPVEEANWIAGAEWADSIGVDIVNASLGYTVFNDTTLGHWYYELNGHTAIGSRGAAIAASTGMIICNSAGNSGDEPWKHLGVPADAPGVLAVGAVTHDGRYAKFSSTGPTADGRIKPDLVAPGDGVVVAGEYGTQLGLSSGTSLASPMLAGAIASLWSAFPGKTALEITGALYQSADQSANPDNLRGYGLPDLTRAWLTLGGYLSEDTPNNAGAGLFSFDRRAGNLSFLLFKSFDEPPVEVALRDILGRTVLPADYTWSSATLSGLTFPNAYSLPPGYYEVLIRTTSGVTRLAGLAWH